jgi:hypothetical protein
MRSQKPGVRYTTRDFLDRLIVGDGCWEVEAYRRPSGYVTIAGRLMHRFMYELLVGPIPEGLTIDHLCRNRGCANPATKHMEAVTQEVNVLRGTGFPAVNKVKTHCPQGHEYNEANTRYRHDGRWRDCRACARERWQRKRAAA